MADDERLKAEGSQLALKNYGALFSGTSPTSPTPPSTLENLRDQGVPKYGGLLAKTGNSIAPRQTIPRPQEEAEQALQPARLTSDKASPKRYSVLQPKFKSVHSQSPSGSLIEDSSHNFVGQREVGARRDKRKRLFKVTFPDKHTGSESTHRSAFNSELTSGWRNLTIRRVRTEHKRSDAWINDIKLDTNRRNDASRGPNSQENHTRRLQPANGGFVSLNRAAPRSCYICKGTDHKPDQCPQRSSHVSWMPMRSTPTTPSTEVAQQLPARSMREARHVPDPPLQWPNPTTQPSQRPETRRRGRTRLSRWDEEEGEVPRPRGRNGIRRDWKDDDLDDATIERIERKRQRKMERQMQKAKDEAAASDRPIHLPEHISVANLASALKIRGEELFKKLSDLGYTNISPDHVLNSENASLIAMEYGFEPRVYSHLDDSSTSDLIAAPLPADVSSMPQRPPVVTIMGHVDHGKTTILDYLRKSSVAASEHGGITQHIGAFMVPLSNHPGKTITFLDTPGHAAFLSMRQRGANVTDIVVLVVAADDSVMPQTVEAIKHARAAEVPIIVAVNKVDKEEAKPERVKQDLARHGIEVEDFGGDVQCVEVSGKTGMGMKELEEAIVTLCEVLEKRAPTNGAVEGWVLEATKNRSGKIATVLVRRGTLRPGDVIVAGTTWARVRSLRNEAGVVVAEACPGTPVEVEGWKGEPGAGDEVLQAPDEDRAGEVVEFRLMQVERKRLAEDMEAINEARRLQQEKRQKEEATEKSKKLGEWGDALYGEDIAHYEDTSAGIQEVYFIVKADVAGSAEAVINAISALGNNEVRAHILRSGTGTVSEFDVEHAAAAKGHIIAFNTRMEPPILQMAAQAGVRIVDRSIIYRVVEDVTTMLSEKLPPRIVTSVTGEAEIAQLFDITIKGRKKMKIAGCKVRNGVVKRGSKTRVLRGTETIYDGKLAHFPFPR